MPTLNIPTIWSQIAQHVVAGLGVQPGHLILVQDRAGRQDVLLAMLMAIELAGATPLPELVSNPYLNELLRNASPAYLENWERHRREWMGQVDAILNLAGQPLDLAGVPEATARAFLAATQRVGEVEEARGVPNLVLATPDQAHAAAMGIDLAELERRLLPALAADPLLLRREIDQVLTAVANSHTITIHSGDNCTLNLRLADGRAWLIDDGVIDAGDRAGGAVVSNLPAGSIYTTVLESATEGTLWLPRPQGQDVVATFANGRIIHVTPPAHAATFWDMLNRRSGEPGRVGHVGIGLNPYLNDPIGWPLVDEHVRGYLFVSLGENRYMGGENESSLNMDFAIPHATLLADDRVIVKNGRVAL